MAGEVEYTPPVTVKAGQIQFVEACHPPLVAGDYLAAIHQRISESKDALVPWNSDPYAARLAFSVDAPRFTLNPGDIHSVYPPVNEIGRFDNALPHVVFTRRTLPWERKLDGLPPQFGEAFPPWMALLLLQEEELQAFDNRGEFRTLPVFSHNGESLLRSFSRDVLVPNIGQSVAIGTGDDAIRRQAWERDKWRYEDGARSCMTIDLPAVFFKALAPRTSDLPYLAHVRQVDTRDKEVLGTSDRGWFSMVLGNRLPEAEKSHRVLLVSLEGLQDRLQDSWMPPASEKVRLAVLGSWTFACSGSNDFKATLDRLNFDSATPPGVSRASLPESGLHLPYLPYDEKSASAETIVNAAYSRGYTAFDHAMRHGERTVSWYRGPLVPLSHQKPTQIQEPVSCADELLYYDPSTGLFDVAYAAAWQLGRLLALQNQGFALALERARGVLQAKAERLLREDELRQLRQRLGLPNKNYLEDSLMEYMAGPTGQTLTAAVPK